MKDYTIVANNKNQTQITFSYDHGLPYKDFIRPKYEYGDWNKNISKTLIKVYLDDEDMELFENKEKILALKIYEIENDFWIDLKDVYLVIRKNEYLNKKFKEHNLMIVFLHNDNIINGFSFNE